MKNRFISPSKAQLVRSKAVNSGLNVKGLAEINPAIRSLTLILSNKRLNQAGHL